MKKIKIHYTISQPLCGQIKRVCVIGRSDLHIKTMMLTTFPGHTFLIQETFSEIVDDTYPSGIFNEGECIGIVGSAALQDNNFQYQSHS